VRSIVSRGPWTQAAVNEIAHLRTLSASEQHLAVQQANTPSSASFPEERLGLASLNPVLLGLLAKGFQHTLTQSSFDLDRDLHPFEWSRQHEWLEYLSTALLPLARHQDFIADTDVVPAFGLLREHIQDVVNATCRSCLAGEPPSVTGSWRWWVELTTFFF
jgi:hypothetical protein